MHAISEQDILNIWEIGLRQHPIERALTVLALAEQLARSDALVLSVGQRDACLLDIHEYTFGPQFAGYAECPQCQEPLEINFEANDICMVKDKANDKQAFCFQRDNYEVQIRLPDSTDLLAIAECRNVETARALLLQRCIISAEHDGNAISISELPESLIVALGEAVVEYDPHAEIRLGLVCPSCSHCWFAVFDILTFLWQEITTHAKRLLREVHLLASAYGWRESDILAISAVRRRLYLEMVSS